MPAKFIPLPNHHSYSPEEMTTRAADFYAQMQCRRTVRDFSPKPIPREVIENCLLAAGTAPNGANMQPWHFVVVSDPEIKRKMREGAEREEHEFYERIAPPEWLAALEPLGTNEQKPFLETAPYSIVVFSQNYGLLPDGRKVKHYYAKESVGIATGLLIAAFHHAGLVSLTHTPSPMGFLNEVLDRPSNEKPFLILVVGHPAEDAQVPDVHRKPLSQIATWR